MGALAAPLMLTVLPAKTAAGGIAATIFGDTDFWVVYIWRGYTVKRLLAWMVVMGIAGQVLGWMVVISYIDDQTLKARIGGLALFMGARYWYRVYKPAIGVAAAHA